MGVEELTKALETVSNENQLTFKQHKELFDRVFAVVDGYLAEVA